jgi:hypothetical protein
MTAEFPVLAALDAHPDLCDDVYGFKSWLHCGRTVAAAAHHLIANVKVEISCIITALSY